MRERQAMGHGPCSDQRARRRQCGAQTLARHATGRYSTCSRHQAHRSGPATRRHDGRCAAQRNARATGNTHRHTCCHHCGWRQQSSPQDAWRRGGSRYLRCRPRQRSAPAHASSQPCRWRPQEPYGLRNGTPRGRQRWTRSGKPAHCAAMRFHFGRWRCEICVISHAQYPIYVPYSPGRA